MGRQGGRQVLSVGGTCTFARGTIMHEMMHAVGFQHEQTRTDRDQFVTIFFQNIQRGKEIRVWSVRLARNEPVAWQSQDLISVGKGALIDTYTCIGLKRVCDVVDLFKFQHTSSTYLKHAKTEFNFVFNWDGMWDFRGENDFIMIRKMFSAHFISPFHTTSKCIKIWSPCLI